MKVSFQDFYGQFVNINNETASGNIRMRVRTCENLNDISKEEDCKVETDISLNQAQLKILIGALECMVDQY